MYKLSNILLIAGLLVVLLAFPVVKDGAVTDGTAIQGAEISIWINNIILIGISFILAGTAIRKGVDHFKLLQTPRLAVMLTCIVMLMMAITVAGVVTGTLAPTRISLFPLVILTLTVERFAVLQEEDGLRTSLKAALGTLIAVSAAYGVMSWITLQTIVVTFPETLLLVVATLILFGRWSGMRLSEYLRFREL